MTQKLNLTILLLLTVSFAFAQQNVVNTSKSNVKDRVILDGSTNAVKKTTAAKNPILEDEKAQAKTEGQPVRGQIVKGGRNPGASMYFIITTTKDGSFSAKLDEGSYTISVNADELKKTIAELKSKDEKINGATFVFDLPANFEFSGTENANKNGEYVAPKFEFTIIVPKEGTTFSGRLLTTTTLGLSIKPTVNEKGSGQPKNAGF
jgi:hypothetical protein